MPWRGHVLFRNNVALLPTQLVQGFRLQAEVVSPATASLCARPRPGEARRGPGGLRWQTQRAGMLVDSLAESLVDNLVDN